MSKRAASIPDVLRTCYDEQAEHFDQTRKKQRPELPRIAAHVRTYLSWSSDWQTASEETPTLSVLDVGCGSGRLFEPLHIVLPTDTVYTGIDFAPGMIATAKKKYPEANRKVADMLEYITNLPQESVDLIVGVASIQHLFPARDRQLFFSHIYRALKWRGLCLLTNRSYSSRFIRKYRLQQLQASADSVFLAQRKRNDLLISRKDPNYAQNKKKYERYYHLFTLRELKELSLLSGFVVEELTYMQQDGTTGDDRKQARNSLLAIRKDIC